MEEEICSKTTVWCWWIVCQLCFSMVKYISVILAFLPLIVKNYFCNPQLEFDCLLPPSVSKWGCACLRNLELMFIMYVICVTSGCPSIVEAFIHQRWFVIDQSPTFLLSRFAERCILSLYSQCTHYLVRVFFSWTTASIRRGMERISLNPCWGVKDPQVA